MLYITLQNTVVALLVLITSFKHCSCECVKSYTTICDTIDDFSKKYDGTWTDVLIKSEKPGPLPPMVTFEFITFRKLTSLIIVGQIDKISTELVPYCTHKTNLKFLSLYGNKVRKLKSNFFSRELKLQKLSLVNNQIESIEAETFTTPQIQVIDLSENLLEVIVSNTFKKGKSKSNTKSIIISNNKLALIEPNSFPTSLKILRLDNNELRFFQDGVIDNLVHLQGLFLRHNKLLSVPNIKQLNKLIVLDISHNTITSIDGAAFKNLENLQSLNLGYNKIKQVEFLKPLLVRNNFLDVSLAFNHVNDLKVGIDTNVSLSFNSLILFGNPWWCHKWISILSFLNQTEMKQTECDLAYFNSGKFPFCISFQGKPNFFPNASGIVGYDVLGGPELQISDEELESFTAAIETKMKSVGCELSVRRHPDENILYTDSMACNSPGLVFVEA